MPREAWARKGIPDALADVRGQHDEEMALGTREIDVHYRSGMAHSKLKIPAASAGTARNMNTVATLAEWAADSVDGSRA